MGDFTLNKNLYLDFNAYAVRVLKTRSKKGLKMTNHKLVCVAALAVLASGGARAGNPPLPNLVNLNFALTAHSPKGSFSYVDPVGWTGGTGLIFIDSTMLRNQDAAGSPYLTTYGDPVGSVTGNYVEADGNPIFESGFSYSVSGLTVGKTYSLSFYQGASSQAGFGLQQLCWQKHRHDQSVDRFAGHERSRAQDDLERRSALWSHRNLLQQRSQREHRHLTADERTLPRFGRLAVCHRQPHRRRPDRLAELPCLG